MSEENEIQAAEVGNEEAADFARLEMMAADGESLALAGITEPEPPKVDAAESLGALLGLVSAGASVAGFERTAALWSAEKCNELAAVAVPVFRKYPWGMRIIDFMETGAGVEELALGAFVVPMVLATVKTVKADTAKAEKPEKQADQVQQAMPRVGEMREMSGHANG